MQGYTFLKNFISRLLKYTPLDAVSICRQNVLFLKLNICLGGFELFRLKVSQFPLDHIRRQIKNHQPGHFLLKS